MDSSGEHAWIYLPSSLFLLLLSNCLFLLYHLFLRKTVKDEKDSIFDFLLMVIATCFQVFSFIHVYMIFNYYLFLNDIIELNPPVLCIILNVRLITAITIIIAMFLINLIFFLFFVLPDWAKNCPRIGLRNICMFFLLWIPSYQVLLLLLLHLLLQHVHLLLLLLLLMFM